MGGVGGTAATPPPDDQVRSVGAVVGGAEGCITRFPVFQVVRTYASTSRPRSWPSSCFEP